MFKLFCLDSKVFVIKYCNKLEKNILAKYYLDTKELIIILFILLFIILLEELLLISLNIINIMLSFLK